MIKKLLILLGTIPVIGGGTTGIVANNSHPKPKESQKLNRVKRANYNQLENWYCFLCPNRLIAKITHSTWQNIAFHHDTSNNDEFSNFVFGVLNDFKKKNHSGDEYSVDSFWQSDIEILKSTIVNHYDNINDVFLNKNNDSEGIFIRTNRDSYWENNNGSGFWGAVPNRE